MAIVAVGSYAISARYHANRGAAARAPTTATEAAGQAGPWVHFPSPDGRFSADFPGLPTHSDSPSPLGAVEAQTWIFVNEPEAFYLGFADYPAGSIPSTESSTVLDGAMAQLTAKPGRAMTSLTSGTVQGYPARFFHISIGDTELTTVGRAVLVDARIYLVDVTLPLDQALSLRVARFLDSFTLAPAPRAASASSGPQQLPALPDAGRL